MCSAIKNLLNLEFLPFGGKWKPSEEMKREIMVYNMYNAPYSLFQSDHWMYFVSVGEFIIMLCE